MADGQLGELGRGSGDEPNPVSWLMDSQRGGTTEDRMVRMRLENATAMGRRALMKDGTVQLRLGEVEPEDLPPAA